MNWFNRLDAYLKNYYKKEEDIIVCGDFNIAPIDVDVYDPDLWICKTYIHPKIRSSFKKIESCIWIEIFLAKAFKDLSLDFQTVPGQKHEFL